MDDVRKFVAKYNEEALFADGLDEAIIGVAHKYDCDVACYDYDKCIEILIENGMSEEEAVEYFEFNVAGSYFGENTPIYLYKMSED